MPRSFASASTERITVSIGALGFLFPGSAAFIARLASTGINQCLIVDGSTSGNRFIFYITSANKLGYQPGVSSTVVSTTTVTSGKWYLLGMTHGTGTVKPRFHIYDYSADSWVHEDANAASGGPSTPGTSATIGTLADNTSFPLNGDLAVGGVWSSSLSDSEMESLPYSLQPWYAPRDTTLLTASLRALWVFDQDTVSQKLMDMTGGGANESGRTGTTVSPNSVPVFNYGAGVHMVV